MPQRDGALIDELRLQLRDIVVFDGICNLCTRSVKFILKHEAEHRILFAPLQSPAGARLLSDHGFDPNNASTFIFISEGALYTKSAAAIRIASHFKGVWKLARLLRLIPRPLRDWGYDMVARSRYLGSENPTLAWSRLRISSRDFYMTSLCSRARGARLNLWDVDISAAERQRFCSACSVKCNERVVRASIDRVACYAEEWQTRARPCARSQRAVESTRRRD